MTRYILFIFIAILTLVVASVAYLFIAPYYTYNQIVNHGNMNNWYSIANHSSFLTKPEKSMRIDSAKSVNDNLWKRFHFKTVSVPLPVKNPFYFVAPVLTYDKEAKKTEFGLSLYNAKDALLAQIYFLPKFSFPKVLNSQKLFELPIVRNHLMSFTSDKVWSDIFVKDISDWDISLSDMVYNLYLLELRSKIINKRVIKYYLLENNNDAILKLDFADKDYESFLVLNKRGNYIYSYVLNHKINNPEAIVLRNKFFTSIGFLDTTPSLTDIIYQEFKSLPFRKQIDHEGMLFLLSSWSHNQQRLEILASSIQFLERGRENQRQLEPLYDYVFERTGKTFSRRAVGGVRLRPEVLLKRNIELEQALKKSLIKEIKEPEKKLSIQEQYDKILEDTRKRLWDDKSKIRMN